VNRSYSALRWAGFGLMPLALGITLPSIGVDLKLLLAALGLFAGFIATRRMQRIEDGTTTGLRRIIVLSMFANGVALIGPLFSKLAWLEWISTAAGFAGPIAYLLLARAGIAIARSQSDASLERSWQRCVWIGLPLILSSSLFWLAWWVVAGFPKTLHFESHNLLVVMGGTLVLSLPAILLFQALFATEKAIEAALGTQVRLLVRIFAHPSTVVLLAFLLLTPSLILVPDAIHFAVTPTFNQFLTRNRSTLSFDTSDGMRVLERHTGPVCTSEPWLDLAMEPKEQRAERVGYDLSVELTRPGVTLLNLTNSLQIKVEPLTYDDFRGMRVATEVKAIDPRFHLAITVFLNHRTVGSEEAGAPVPALEFMVRVALMAGPGDTVVETLLVDALPSMLVPPKMSAGALSYIWQARGKFELVSYCIGQQCLSSRVRYHAEQRFALATEEYSYAMKSALAMNLQAKGPGTRSEYTVKSDGQNKSKETSWNDIPW